MKKKCGKIKKHFISIPVVKFLINSVYFWYIWSTLFGYWKETWYEKPRPQGCCTHNGLTWLHNGRLEWARLGLEPRKSEVVRWHRFWTIYLHFRCSIFHIPGIPNNLQILQVVKIKILLVSVQSWWHDVCVVWVKLVGYLYWLTV